ncbi:MAG: hypothetical protein QXJ97_08680 [Desulfurococcaceae archaeon]
MSSETLKRYLMNKLKDTTSDVLSNVLSLALTKRELLNMSSEELDLVKSFVIEYRGKRYALRPVPFEQFLTDEKYKEDYTALVRIPLEELIKRGILFIAEENGKPYWYLYGEKLDPKQYYRLYLKDRRVFRTLLEELGLAELIERFNVEPTPRDPLTIFTINIGKIKIEARYTFSEQPNLLLSSRTNINGSTDPELPKSTSVEVLIDIRNPKVEDFLKVENIAKDIESDAKAKVIKIVNWFKKNVGDRINEADIEVSGIITVRNFEISTYTLTVKSRRDIDSISSLAIEVLYEAPQKLKMSVAQTIKSHHLVSTLRDVGVKSTSIADGGGEYTIDVNTKNKTVAFGFSKEYDVAPDLENLPDVSEVIDTVVNAKTILYDVVANGLKNIESKKLTVYVRDRREELDRTVRGFLEEVGWREDQTVEEAILRIWMIKTILDNIWEPEKVRPDIISILISLTYLKGAPHDFILDKVEKGIDYAVNLALRGRLKITEHDVYLDGKRFDINPTKDSFIKSVLYAIKFLTSSEKKNTDTEKTRIAIEI